MYPPRFLFATVLVVLVCGGCTESPTTPAFSEGLSGLVVSAPVRLPGGGGYSAYVSLVPGRVTGAVDVDVRNVTERVDALEYAELLDGGFDPVPVPASVNDLVEVRVRFASGRSESYRATVPDRQRPTIVRMSVVANARNVPVDTRLRIVFSEPIDAQSLPGRVRLSGWSAWDQVALVPGQPWIVEVVQATTLEPEAGLRLEVSRGIENLAGQATLWPTSIYFTTETAPSFEVTDPGRIAFASTREGGPSIYVANPDGGGLTRLITLGESPAWSPDGLRIAFHSSSLEIFVIDADGSNARVLASDSAAQPTWSPDGQRIAFARRGEILVVNTDGGGEELLISRQSLLAATGAYDEAHGPMWSPDGLRIAMVGRGSSTLDGILIANADGSGISRLNLGNERRHVHPAWSPDGSRLALVLASPWELGGGAGTVVSAAPDGSDVRVHAYIGSYPAWSSDGTQLLYARSPRGLDLEGGDWDHWGSTRIFVADLVTGRRRQIVPDLATHRYSDYDATWFRPGP